MKVVLKLTAIFIVIAVAGTFILMTAGLLEPADAGMIAGRSIILILILGAASALITLIIGKRKSQDDSTKPYQDL